jgi:integrase
MRERTPGHWELRLFGGNDPVTGKQIRRTKTFVGSGRAAAKALGAFVQEVQSSDVTRRGVTVGEILDEWLEQGRSKQTPRTLQENRRKIDHRIRPLLGDLRLEKLDASRLDKTYRHWLDEGLSEATVHKYHCILSAACRQAVKWDYLDRAPTDKASPPSIVRREPKTPTPEQLADLIGMAEIDDPLMATAIALAALTGIRRSELVALQWSDVDMAAGRVRIWKGLTVADGRQYIGDTKTHAARELALDSIAVEVLRRRWEFVADKSAEGESPLVADPYVLSFNLNGEMPVNPDTLTHRFERLCRKMERPALEELWQKKPKATSRDLAPPDRWPFTFHGLRHFSVTTLIAAGMDIKTVADRHGRRRATMTLDLYAHALPERDREAAGVLGQALEQAKTQRR